MNNGEAMDKQWMSNDNTIARQLLNQLFQGGYYVSENISSR